MDPGSAEEAPKLTLLSRDELETQVRERTAYLEKLMDTMVDVLLVVDADGRIEMTNQALANVLGYEKSQMEGSPIEAIFAPPDENEQLSDMLTEDEFLERLLTQGQVTDVEIYFSKRNGDPIPMSVSASVMRDEDDGGVIGIVCVAKDISERKEAEETAEFLHSLLRHDLGNKLQVMEGSLEILDGAVDEQYQQHLNNARDSLSEAIELIRNVQTLQRLEGQGDLEPRPLTAALSDVVDNIEGLRDSVGMDIETDIDDDLRVMAGPLLKELFTNIVENGLNHSNGTQMEIDAYADGSECVVTIADDGDGIPDDRKEEIFGKRVSGRESNGSGLGLHLVSNIVDRYGGDIHIEDAELGGAEFVIRLQAADGNGRVQIS